MHGAHNTCQNACILSAKNAYALVHVRICTCAEDFLSWKLLRTYLESCVSIVQAAVCRSLLLSVLLSRPNAVRSRNRFKSALTHDAVAVAVLHMYHSIICVGAGLIQFVYGSHLCLTSSPTKFYFRQGFRGLFRWCAKLLLQRACHKAVDTHKEDLHHIQ